MNVQIDIETIPQQPEEEAKKTIAENIQHPGSMKKPETIRAWHEGEGQYEGVKDALIEEQYRKTSFDGAKGQVCSVAWAIGDNINASKPGSSEGDILETFFSSMRNDLSGRPPYFIGHYIGGFDLKFLFQRAVVLGVNPGFDLCQWGRHDRNFYDTMLAWAGYGGSISLDNLCLALGIPGKGDDIDGSKVWDFYKAGKHQEIVDYNKSDVEKVIQVYECLTFSDKALRRAA